METLNVKTVRGAKHYIKYHRTDQKIDFPFGGVVYGYDTDDDGNERQVYRCDIKGQHEKLPGGRRCFSDREQVLEDLFGKPCNHYPKGTDCTDIFIKPKYFKVQRHGG